MTTEFDGNEAFEFRQEVLAHVQRVSAPDTPQLAQLSVGGLVALYNRRVPDHLALRVGSKATLTVQLGGRRPTARDMELVQKRLTRAIASVGQEIRNPSAGPAQMTRWDYDKAPLYVRAFGDSIIFQPDQDLAVMEAGTPSTSRRAMTRLTHLLPESADALTMDSLDALLSAQPPSRRAVREVALAAAASRGLTITLRLPGVQDVRAEVTESQADEITKMLDRKRIDTTSITMVGVLDGGRMKRRIFYMLRDNFPEVHGSIDEELVDRVFSLTGKRVTAHLEVTRTVTAAGATGRPVYRLTGVQPTTQLPGD